MCGEVICGVPFHAANIGRCRNRGMFTGEMPFGVVAGAVWHLGVGDDVDVVQEYPKDFFDDVVHFFEPYSIRPRVVY